jgi:hypothetical protein
MGTNYNGETLDVDEAAWTELYSTKSCPFDRPDTARCKMAKNATPCHDEEGIKATTRWYGFGSNHEGEKRWIKASN